MFVSVAGILHADADAFFASVEQRDDPRLRGRPVIVGSGVVMAASYEARAFGIRGAMGGARARRLCPHAVVVQPRFGAYVEASRALFDVFEDFAPVVEGLSLEEAFLDVRGLERISGAPLEIGARLRAEVRERVGLAVTVGVARTKVLAKMASRAAKPDGLLEIEPERELAFLRPLPVSALWGVGPRNARKLEQCGVTTIAEAADLPLEALVAILGRASGRHVHALANNRDPRRVRAGRRRRSVGSQCALGRRADTSPAALDAIVVGLADRVTRRMRGARLAGRTVTLRLRFADFTRASRSRTLRRSTASTATVLAAARALLAAAMPVIERRGCTLVGLTVASFDPRGAGVQLALALERRPRARLDAALDQLRRRYGADAITRATLLRPGSRLRPSLLEEPGHPRRRPDDGSG